MVIILRYTVSRIQIELINLFIAASSYHKIVVRMEFNSVENSIIGNGANHLARLGVPQMNLAVVGGAQKPSTIGCKCDISDTWSKK